MESLKARVDGFQCSRAGLFVTKIMDDQAPNLAALLAWGLSSLIGNVPLGLPIGPVLAKVVGWSISIISAFLFFLLIYKVLPHAKQGWRDVLPGTLLSSVLLLVISQIFPLYVTFFPPNHAYAVFGVFLVFTLYLYLLGFVLVLGVELNAFLHEPARSVALAEATAKAQHGQTAYDRQTDADCLPRPSPD